MDSNLQTRLNSNSNSGHKSLKHAVVLPGNLGSVGLSQQHATSSTPHHLKPDQLYSTSKDSHNYRSAHAFHQFATAQRVAAASASASSALKPPINVPTLTFEPQGYSQSSTPNKASVHGVSAPQQLLIQQQSQQQQQRALTQLYQQTTNQSTPLPSKGKHHSTNSGPKASTKSHSNASANKKDHSTRQVDLQAKFASLLRQSKAAASKDQSSLAPHSAKGSAYATTSTRSKADKGGQAAANARNALFGESQQAKQAKDTKKHQQQHLQSPPRNRQTPLTQQMLIIQNSAGSPPQGMAQQQRSVKTSAGVSAVNTHSSKTGFPRQSSQTVPASIAEHFLQSSPQTRHEAHAMPPRDHRHSQQQITTASRHAQQASSQTRKKKARNHSGSQSNTAASALSRPSANAQSSHGPNGDTQSAVLAQAEQQHWGATVRPSQTSGKSKKKKQQPSQQSVTLDPVEEYLANAARLQTQMQLLNGLPAAANNTPALSSATQPNLQLLQPEQSITPVRTTEPAQPVRSDGFSQSEPNLSAILSGLHSQSMQALLSSTPHQQNQPGGLTGIGSQQSLQNLESVEAHLFAQFKQKCQQEMQTQTKQALAKLLYTKREILQEVKAVQANLSKQIANDAKQSNSAASGTKTDSSKQSKQASAVANQISELAVKEQIKSAVAKVTSQLKTEQQEANEAFEERIDGILEQIQTIMSGLEDSTNNKIDSLESGLAQVVTELEPLLETLPELSAQIEKANQESSQALELTREHAQRFEVKMNDFVDKDVFEQELDKLRKQTDSIVKMPAFLEKNTDEPLNEVQIGEVDDKLHQLHAQLIQASHQDRLINLQEAEERQEKFHEEMSELVSRTLEDAQIGFEQIQKGVKDQVHSIVKKAFASKEAALESKMEKSKQQFLKAINGNMRILDNLISDYTTRTHDQIKQQLRSGGPNSRTQTSQRLHSSGHEEGVAEELRSISGSALSQRSQPYQSTLQIEDRGAYQRTLDGLMNTGNSQQLQGSLSSVQDVSDTKSKPVLADVDLSSQLLSTARDRQLQQEAAAQQLINLVNPSNQKVPQLKIDGAVRLMPSVQFTSNSERLQAPQSFHVGHSTDNATVSRSGNPLLVEATEYASPQKNLLNSLIQNASMRKVGQKAQSSSQMIIVEEHGNKFTNSQEESSSALMEPRGAVQSSSDRDQNLVTFNELSQAGAAPFEPRSSLQPGRESSSGLLPHSAHSAAIHPVDKDEIGRIARSLADSSKEKEAKSASSHHESGDHAEKSLAIQEEVKVAQVEEYRHLMEGDLQERSMDQIPFQEPDASSKVMRKTVSNPTFSPTENEALNNVSRHRNQEMFDIQGHDPSRRKTQPGHLKSEEPVDFALSRDSPYLVQSYGLNGQSNDSGSITGAAYHFGFASSNTQSCGMRSQSIKQGADASKGEFRGTQSSRVNPVTSPVQVLQRGPTGSSVYKPEQTDSDFFNLTAEDESQMDPVQVMRNLSNLQLTSMANSMIQIQETSGEQAFAGASPPMPTPTGAQHQHEDQQHLQAYQQESIKNGWTKEKAFNLMEVDNLPDQEGVRGSAVILADQPVRVELIPLDQSRGLYDHNCHVKEMTPSPLDIQRSVHEPDGAIYQQKTGNGLDQDSADFEALSSHRNKQADIKSTSEDEQPTLSAFFHPPQRSGEQLSDEAAPDKELGNDSDSLVDNSAIARLAEEGERRQLQSMQQAGKKQQKRKQDKQMPKESVLLRPLKESKTATSGPKDQLSIQPSNLMRHQAPQLESSSHSSTQPASKPQQPSIGTQRYTRGKKPGSDLPANLQRLGNEIIHNLLLQEVISALDEVIHLSGDQLNEIILDQHNAITISNRNLIVKARTTAQKRVVTNVDEDGVMHDNSDRYELSGSDDCTIQMDQSAEELAPPDSPVDSQDPSRAASLQVQTQRDNEQVMGHELLQQNQLQLSGSDTEQLGAVEQIIQASQDQARGRRLTLEERQEQVRRARGGNNASPDQDSGDAFE